MNEVYLPINRTKAGVESRKQRRRGRRGTSGIGDLKPALIYYWQATRRDRSPSAGRQKMQLGWKPCNHGP